MKKANTCEKCGGTLMTERNKYCFDCRDLLDDRGRQFDTLADEPEGIPKIEVFGMNTQQLIAETMRK